MKSHFGVLPLLWLAVLSATAWTPTLPPLLPTVAVCRLRYGRESTRQLATTSDDGRAHDRPHQRTAVERVEQALFDPQPNRPPATRATVIMPGGSGKTRVGLRVAERALREAGEVPRPDQPSKAVLVLVPTLALIEQAASEYRAHAATVRPTTTASWSQHMLCVCSRLADPNLEHTTSPGAIAARLARAARGEFQVIFSTYRSCHVVVEAQRQAGGNATIALVVFDEAHVTAAAGVHTALALSDSNLRAARRLFLTATPRVFGRRLPKATAAAAAGTFPTAFKGGDMDALPWRSMDDPTVYGAVVHQLGYHEAIDLGVTVPVRLVVLSPPPRPAGVPATAAAAAPEAAAVRSRLLASAAQVACERHGISKIIAFHRTNARSRETLRAARDLAFFDTLLLDGRMKATNREAVLQRLRDDESADTQRPLLVCNAKLLTTGVDLPTCDCVLLVDPMQSHVEIQQVMARAARRAPGKKCGFVLVPPVDDDEGTTTVMEVLRAQLETVPNLLPDLRRWCQQRGQFRPRGDGSSEDPEALSVELQRLLLFDSSTVPAETLADVLETVVVDLLGTWDHRAGLLARYRDEHGHCLVPRQYEVDGVKLGAWVGNQRSTYARGALSKYRQHVLQDLGFVFDVHESEWQRQLARLARFVQEQGHSLVPASFDDGEELQLSAWVTNQRRARTRGSISETRVAQLDALGFVWDVKQHEWQRWFGLLVRYREEFGHCAVPQAYREPSTGAKLGVWVAQQRKAATRGRMTDDRRHRLEELGFVWTHERVESTWEARFQELQQYRKTHGDCLVPRGFTSPKSGSKLGAWVGNQRTAWSKGRLPQERVDRLAAMGFAFDIKEAQWATGLAHLQEFHRQCGHAHVSTSHTVRGSFRLGFWLNQQRHTYAAGKLSSWRVEQLEALGVIWEPSEARFEVMFTALVQFHAKHGHCLVQPTSSARGQAEGAVSEEEARLHRWLTQLRARARRQELDGAHRRRLEALGVNLSADGRVSEEDWEARLTDLEQFQAVHGHCRVPARHCTDQGVKLGAWVGTQRMRFRRGSLQPARQQQLDALGFVWAPNEDQWDARLEQLERFRAEHGHVQVPATYCTEDGLRLGRWVLQQRKSLAAQQLSTERRQRLAVLGLLWSPGTRHRPRGGRNRRSSGVPNNRTRPRLAPPATPTSTTSPTPPLLQDPQVKAGVKAPEAVLDGTTRDGRAAPAEVEAAKRLAAVRRRRSAVSRFGNLRRVAAAVAREVPVQPPGDDDGAGAGQGHDVQDGELGRI